MNPPPLPKRSKAPLVAWSLAILLFLGLMSFAARRANQIFREEAARYKPVTAVPAQLQWS